MSESIHLVFTLLGWGIAATLRLWSVRHFAIAAVPLPPHLRWRYTIVLLLGAANGALLSGSFNLWQQFPNAIGHSVLGAIIGGVVTVELFKYAHKLRHSTGVIWALPLAVGIAIGRLGCFFAGLEDYTYGTPTTMPWGVDFGDGVPRHPVQLYESAAMLWFAFCALMALQRKNPWFLRNGFYAFALFYGLQRFGWEFLKPYAVLFAGLNLFHLLCLLLIGYALFMINRQRPHEHISPP